MLAHAVRIAVLVILSFVVGFFLSHVISDVVLDHHAIRWIWSAVNWIRDCFFPSIREPDDLEGMYLMLLVLMCWLVVLAILLALCALIQHRKRMQRS
ncbi:hypothetical protein K788_00005030 [Paraburkholderia caribensis MBA4]|uniref:Transmembrane protein n=1 Tax=Paraburkholderia caribensis MBA4 TaxID=1323664 RepID=A0A0P0RH26_9BURK|nr:hypothetical protein K788_00005030 [Paraburkholderia caribensis MBA4]